MHQGLNGCTAMHLVLSAVFLFAVPGTAGEADSADRTIWILTRDHALHSGVWEGSRDDVLTLRQQSRILRVRADDVTAFFTSRDDAYAAQADSKWLANLLPKAVPPVEEKPKAPPLSEPADPEPKAPPAEKPEPTETFMETTYLSETSPAEGETELAFFTRSLSEARALAKKIMFARQAKDAMERLGRPDKTMRNNVRVLLTPAEYRRSLLILALMHEAKMTFMLERFLWGHLKQIKDSDLAQKDRSIAMMRVMQLAAAWSIEMKRPPRKRDDGGTEDRRSPRQPRPRRPRNQ